MGGGEFVDMDGLERTAHITRRLMLGEALSTRQIALEYGISRQWAYTTLSRASRVIPLYADGALWRVSDVCQLE
jgi:hypothetical protein